jgi:acetyl-CoA C-acetyltransferase
MAGLPVELPSETINKVCASGMRAVALADQAIRAGDLDVAVAGGMESMSNAPYVLQGARFGYRMGNRELVDAMVHDGLVDPFTRMHMGEHNTDVADECHITREEQDRWALASHQRAISAMDEGRLAEEIVPVEVSNPKGGVALVSEDEGPRRDTSLEALAALKPAFRQEGTTTAGNAPGINDGAAALVVVSEAYAAQAGLRPLARILSIANMAQQPQYFPTTPARAARKALEKAGLTPTDVDLWEINEAFAAVAAYAARVLEIDPAIVNVNGGAVAFGHPIGASGARIVLTLALELRRRGGGIGVASICSGTAQGDAMVIEVPA